MPRDQLNIRLDPLTQEVLRAIAEAIGDDPKLPPSDVTALVKKAIKLYINQFRDDPKYRASIEETERTFAERENDKAKGSKLGPIPVKRKQPSSVSEPLITFIAEKEVGNECASANGSKRARLSS